MGRPCAIGLDAAQSNLFRKNVHVCYSAWTRYRGYLTELVDRFYDAEDLPARWETSAADWRRKLMADNDALIDCEKHIVEKGIVLMTVNRPFWK